MTTRRSTAVRKRATHLGEKIFRTNAVSRKFLTTSFFYPKGMSRCPVLFDVFVLFSAVCLQKLFKIVSNNSKYVLDIRIGK